MRGLKSIKFNLRHDARQERGNKNAFYARFQYSINNARTKKGLCGSDTE